MNKAEMKAKRQAILKQIDLLELKRCKKCAKNMPTRSDPNCNCHAAKKIRKLGEELTRITANQKKRRIEAVKRQVKNAGLTTKTYHQLRDSEIPLKEIRELGGMTQKEFAQWRSENQLKEREYLEPIEVQLKKINITVEQYKRENEAGMFDMEICKKYSISKSTMYEFKKMNGLTLPRGAITGKRRMRKAEQRKKKSVKA